jgi:organic radical activating enzyme
MNDLRIVEIFDSIQGEGPHIGLPATFVRLAGCNMKCPWCDTKNSWNNPMQFYKEMKTTELIKILIPRKKHIIFTGGEPTVQLREQTTFLFEKLHSFDKVLHLETNGFVFIKHIATSFDTIVVSPKLPYSEEHVLLAGKGEFSYIDSIRQWGEHGAYLKFVIDVTYEDFENNIDIALGIAKATNIPFDRVYFQPMSLGTTDEERDTNHEYYNTLAAAIIDMKVDVHVLPQLHRWMDWK